MLAININKKLLIFIFHLAKIDAILNRSFFRDAPEQAMVIISICFVVVMFAMKTDRLHWSQKVLRTLFIGCIMFALSANVILQANETRMAEERLTKAGEKIAYKIKDIIKTPFASSRTLAKKLLTEKIEAEQRNEIPNRQQVEKDFVNYLKKEREVRAIFCAWEKNAFDGRDKDFIGKENPDPEMDIINVEYVSEGAFLPWFYRDEDKDGNPKIAHAFLDDYLVSEANYYIGPRDSKKEFVTEPYSEAGIPITVFCIPIIKDDKVLGVAGLEFGLDKLQALLKRCKPFEDGFVMFLSPKGRIVYYPVKEINYKTVPNYEADTLEQEYRAIDEIPALAETAKRIKEKNTGVYTSMILPGWEGKKMLVVHIPVQFGDCPDVWLLVVVAPADQVKEKLDSAVL